MFLATLTDDEKILFVSLCMHGATVGGNQLTKNENTIIQTYCMEMRMPGTVKCETDLDKVLNRLNKHSSDRTKRIMLIEFLGLMNAEGDMSQDKKDFMTKFCDRVGISQATYMSVSRIWSDYRDICQEMYTVIDTGEI